MIQNFWRHKIVLPFNIFTQGIKNLIKWFPLIWRDRDFDYRYTIDVLAFKLKNQRDYLCSDKSYRIEEDQTQIKRDINICLNLIEKIYGDNPYDVEYLDYETSRFWFEETENPKWREWKHELLSENFDEYFFKNKLIHKKAQKYLINNAQRYSVPFTDRALQARTISDLKQEKAQKLLFKILSERIRGWWD